MVLSAFGFVILSEQAIKCQDIYFESYSATLAAYDCATMFIIQIERN